jgi:hypothetical protein
VKSAPPVFLLARNWEGTKKRICFVSFWKNSGTVNLVIECFLGTNKPLLPLLRGSTNHVFKGVR